MFIFFFVFVYLFSACCCRCFFFVFVFFWGGVQAGVIGMGSSLCQPVAPYLPIKHSFASYFTTEVVTIPLDKHRCERSKDNKLVIWSKNSSGNPTQTNQSTQANPPRLPYQRLLRRVTSTPPPEGDESAPVTSPTVGLGEEFPYQKLIKTVASTESSGQQGSDNGETPEADVSLYDETSQKPYQCLSLKRNPMVRIFLLLNGFSFVCFFILSTHVR